ncbi:MAG TPA: rhodanese-like domain-containing protein [Bacteroidota bacterium]|nr:rhodanese-like domain-containing protein [Bacteroidota bacterium]
MSGLAEKIKAGATIVDVRTKEEFEEENYPNALNIPVDQIEARLAEFGEKTNPIVVYCASGARSAYAARVLKTFGYSDVVNAGGLYDMPEL